MMRRVCLLLTLLFASTTPLFAANSDFSKWQHRVSSLDSGSILQNDKLAVRFPKTNGVFAEAQVYVRTSEGAKLMAIVRPFFRLAFQDNGGDEQALDISARSVTKRFLPDGRLGLEFTRVYEDTDAVQWTMTALVTIGKNDQYAQVHTSLSASRPRKLVVFRPMTLLAGEGSYGTAKDEALFPGLEYLLKGEASSSRLDITAKERKRYAPHPYKVTIPLMSVHHDGYQVALMWDANQRWDGKAECPSSLFASPNFLQNGKNHLMALYLPSFPWVEEYKTKATTPYPLDAGKQLRLDFDILVRPGKHAIDSVDNWIRRYGFPQPPEKPRSWQEQANLSLAPYITAIWRENGKEIGWIPWTGMKPSMNPDTCTLLMLGADVTNDHVLAKKLRDKANYAASKGFADGASSLGFAYTFGPLDSSLKMVKDNAVNLMKNQKPDGSWVFDPPEGKTLLGVELSTLGDRGDTAVGLTAEPAAFLLKYARVTGDEASAEAGLKSLRFMKRFVRPQASQTWECPLHAPDILGSARATEAFLEGYLLTGDEALLANARYWARTGLPFIYMWNARDRSMMLYSTVAVYGASLYTWPWFGRPVQWNGLAYADVIRRLAPYDKTCDWRTIAKGITISGMQQQASSGENKGLYPDSWYLIDDTAGGPWIQPSQYFLGNILAVMGKEHEVRTQVIRTRNGRIHVSAAADIDAAIDHSQKLLRAKLSGGISSRPLLMSVTGMGKPIAVHWDGIRLVEGKDGWSFADGMLFIKGMGGGSGKVQITYESLGYKLLPAGASTPIELRASFSNPVAGQHFNLTAKAINVLGKKISGLKITPVVPDHWVLSAGAKSVKSPGPRETAVMSWKVLPPVYAGGKRSWIAFDVSYNADAKSYKYRDGIAVKPAEPVTVSDVASDIATTDDQTVVKKVVRLRNMLTRRIPGTLAVSAPDGWSVKSKAGMSFSMPGAEYADMELDFIAPKGKSIGRYDASAQVSLGDVKLMREPFELEIPILCAKTQSEIRIDGNLSEWANYLPIKMSPASNEKDAPRNDADLSAKAGAMWDDKFLYVALSVTDNAFIQEKEGPEIWRQDSVQIAFDTLRDRNTGGFEDDDYEYGFALTPTEVLSWRYVCPPEKNIGRMKMRLAIVRSEGKTAYEAAIPWSELEPFVPKAGRTMGFSILINDDDGAGRKILEWGGGIVHEKQPNKFFGLRLVAK